MEISCPEGRIESLHNGNHRGNNHEAQTMKVGRFLIIVILVLIAALVLGRIFLINRAANSRMTPEMREELARAESEPVRIAPVSVHDASQPDDWTRPFEESTQSASRALCDQWIIWVQKASQLANDYSALLKKGPPDPDQLKPLFSRLEEIKPLLEAMEKLIACPDYEIDAASLSTLEPSPENAGIPVPNILGIQVCAKLLDLRSFQETLNGDYEKAFATAENIVRCGKSNSYTLLISQLIGIAAQEIGVRSWRRSVIGCNDRNLLRATLIRQNEVCPTSSTLSREAPIMAMDALGAIRIAARAGVQIESLEGKTTSELMADAQWYEAEYIEKVIIPKLPEGQPREMARKSANAHRKNSALMGGRFVGLEGLAVWIIASYTRPLLKHQAMPNAVDVYTRGDVSVTDLGLLRCFTAAKVYELDRGAPPDDLIDLVPNYLPRTPSDPFSEKAAPLSVSPNGDYYSIGPDKMDQRGELPYDPSNGTVSSGDIYFRP